VQKIIAIVLCLVSVAAADQWYGVQGTLMCGSVPYKNARVWLYDIDIGFDDSMAKTCTDDKGNFKLGGMASDPVGTIDPTLKIYHKCNPDALQIRNWSDKYTLPKNQKQYFTPNTYYPFGTVNLQTASPKRTTDAIQTGFPC